MTIHHKNHKNYSPYGRKYYEEFTKRLNSKNVTIQNSAILGENGNGNRNGNLSIEDKIANLSYSLFHQKKDQEENDDEEFAKELEEMMRKADEEEMQNIQSNYPGLRIIFKQNIVKQPNNETLSKNRTVAATIIKKINLGRLGRIYNEINDDEEEDDTDEGHYYDRHGNLIRTKRNKKKGESSKSEHFEVITKSPVTFKDIGGYHNVKQELAQCIDILSNYTKYSNYNVRTPKGIILEGPPGNGKTLLAKGFAGETETSFIPVSGAEFQEKYVGVGAAKVRELFGLAKKNIPCIIFIDEIDAIGRRRSGDGEMSTGERDNTLNELLVHLDGFNTQPGIFLMGATNRADLLDPALIRPGRIDKRIFIGPPDAATREAVLSIHIHGKPHDKSVNVKDLVDVTNGFSCAQIENILNEAMLNALRENRQVMEYTDVDTIINRMLVGWQPTEHQFTSDIIDRITIHEMGHAIIGFLSKHHSKVSKVVINLSSPTSPGYTMFEPNSGTIYTREALFEHLMILLAGRIAEEVFYEFSATTGALSDFEEAFKLSERMIVHYGMGTQAIYPKTSEKYKEQIDDEVSGLILDAYTMSKMILMECKDLINETADILKREKLLKIDKLTEIIEKKYPHVLDLKIDA
jgi:cell division protease FtsH